jgi:hypothetical protein
VELDRDQPVVWVVAGCLFEVSFAEGNGRSWAWDDDAGATATLLHESVRGDRRHFRFRAEAAGEIALRFRARSEERGMSMRVVTVPVAPEVVSGD